MDGGTSDLAFELQVAAAVTGAPADTNDAGIASFDDTSFAVDANGYVTMNGAFANSFPTDSGTATPSSGALTIAGGEGIDTSASGSTVTIAGEDATTANKGIASFDSADFDVTAGAVTLEDTVVKSVSSDSGSATPSSHAFTIAGGTGVSTSGSSSTVTIDVSGGGFTWTEVTGTSQGMAVNNGYVANNVSLVTCTLPSTAAIGDMVAVVGKGAGLFKIGQNAGQTIHFIDTDTTTGTGGSLTATEQYDALEIICITANTDWVVRNATGNYTVV